MLFAVGNNIELNRLAPLMGHPQENPPVPFGDFRQSWAATRQRCANRGLETLLLLRAT